MPKHTSDTATPALFLTVAEAAELIGITQKAFYGRIKRGTIPASVIARMPGVKSDAWTILIRKSDFLGWLDTL